MVYKDIRDKFIELSGRYDLITATGEDNGADIYLNAGQRYLDTLLDGRKTRAINLTKPASGEKRIVLENLRAVHKVSIFNSDEMTMMEKISSDNMYYLNSSTILPGRPIYYSVAELRPYPDNVTGTALTNILNKESVVADNNHYLLRGIFIYPSTDGSYTIAIEGSFYSPKLSANLSEGVFISTKSFWSEEHPFTLISAGMYKLETMRNNEREINKWKEVIIADIISINSDIYEEESQGIEGIGY